MILVIGYRLRGILLIFIMDFTLVDTSVCNVIAEYLDFFSDLILWSGQSCKTLIDEKCFVKMCFLPSLYPIADRSMQSIL